MVKIGLVFVLILVTGSSYAQQNYFVLIQSDSNQPFYARLGDKSYSSSMQGHLILAPIKDSTYQMEIGFPRQRYPEQQYILKIRQKDQDLRLRVKDDGWWGLYNVQTHEWIEPAPRIAKAAEMPPPGIRKDDAFSRMMAGVVRDTAVLYNTYAMEEMVKDSPVAAVTKSATPPAQGTSTIHDTTSTTKDPISTTRGATSAARNTPPATHAGGAPTTTDSAGTAALTSQTDSSRTAPVSSVNATSSNSGNKKTSVRRPRKIPSSDTAQTTAPVQTASTQGDAVVTTHPTSTIPDSADSHSTRSDSIQVISKSADAMVISLHTRQPASPPAASKDSGATGAHTSGQTDLKTGDPKVVDPKTGDPKVVDSKTTDPKTANPKSTLPKTADPRSATPTDPKSTASKTAAGTTGTSSTIVKLSERRSPRAVRLVYADRTKGHKTDTITVIIPVDTLVVASPTNPAAGGAKTDPGRRGSRSNGPNPDSPMVTTGSSPGTSSLPGTNPTRGSGYPLSPNRSQDTAQKRPPVKTTPAYVNSDCHNYATDYDVDKLRSKMLQASKDEDRIQAARKVFKTKCFSTTQLRALCEVFTTDAVKFRFLETAYPFAADDHFRELIHLLADPVYIGKFKAMTGQQ